MLKQLTGNDPTEENINQTFKDIDEDGSGELDRDEVLAFLKLYIWLMILSSSSSLRLVRE